MSTLHCSNCRLEIPPEVIQPLLTHTCAQCGSTLTIEVYPAFHRGEAPVNAGEKLLIDSEASCFYHLNKQAVVACAACGRFLCALCDLEHAGLHYCPACLESGKRKRKLRSLEDQRVRYDQLALLLALLPILVWPITFVTAPAVIIIVLRYWRHPLSLVRRGKAAFLIAALIALLQIVGWGLVITAMVMGEGR